MKAHASLRVPLVRLGEDELEAVWEEKPEDLGLDLEGAELAPRGPVRVRAFLVQSGQNVLARGRAVAVVDLTCGRCLEEFRYPLRARFHTTYRAQPEEPESTERELTDDEIDEELLTSEIVDLAPVVRENLVLAVPTAPLCKPDCRGLCPTCGANRNTTTCGCPPPQRGLPFEALRALYSEN